MSVFAEATSGPLHCEIHKIDKGQAIEFRGVVAGATALSGQFRFAVIKSGPSGNANINQANSFVLSAGRQTEVTHVSVNRDANSQLAVEFTVTGQDGVTCTARGHVTPT